MWIYKTLRFLGGFFLYGRAFGRTAFSKRAFEAFSFRGLFISSSHVDLI